MIIHNVAAEQGQPPPRVTPAIETVLLQYPWPGNVRELRNLAERVSIFAAGRELRVEDFPANFARGGLPPQPFHAAESSRTASDSAASLDLQQLERVTIQRALAQFHGNRSAAADALGISRRTLQRKLKEYQLAEQNEPDQ